MRKSRVLRIDKNIKNLPFFHKIHRKYRGNLPLQFPFAELYKTFFACSSQCYFPFVRSPESLRPITPF